MPTKRQTASLKSRTRTPEREGFGRGHVADIQRARMIAAMIDVVSERGRANATVAHVVARSGVSRRTFYEVFDDFEDCFLAALDQSLAAISRYVLGVYDHGREVAHADQGRLGGVAGISRRRAGDGTSVRRRDARRRPQGAPAAPGGPRCRGCRGGRGAQAVEIRWGAAAADQRRGGRRRAIGPACAPRAPCGERPWR